MIVIHIDSFPNGDTAFLKECYKGLDDAIILYNPTKAEINKTLEDYPTEDVMMLGHGSPSGLFSTDWHGNVIDHTNAHLLKDRNCIGIWCYAKRFAKQNGLKGYFTDMFISNEGEAKCHGYNATDKEVFAEVEFFAKAVNTLIVDSVPYEDWVERLQSIAKMERDFVRFNYSAMEYFDGTQTPNEEYSLFDNYGYSGATTYPRDYSADLSWTNDSEVQMWFEDYCEENGIVGEWAKEIAYPIFVAGWNSHKYATEI